MSTHPIIKFPYKTYMGIPCPVVSVEIKETMIDAYVDSGALVSIFSIKEADALGINYQTGQPGLVTVGDGNKITVFFHKLPIKIGEISFQATMGFSPKLGVGFNLLGRKDIFERFIVSFNDLKKVVSFLPHRRRPTRY